MSGRTSSRTIKPTPGSGLWDNTKQILIAIVLALCIKTSVVEAYKIPSSSMEDTLLIGDFLLANKFVYGAQLPLVGWRLPAIHDPRPGDVVIFTWPGDGVTKYIKRCVAGPGDTVEVRDTLVLVNGKPRQRPPQSKFIDIEGHRSGRASMPTFLGQNLRDHFGPYVVPKDCYFMMGDNRDNSSDSRVWGPVKKDLVLGQAMLVHWSWYEPEKGTDEFTRLASPEVSVSDPLSVPRLFVFNVVHFFEKVRWNRLFRPIG
jgi:signal peptidase I